MKSLIAGFGFFAILTLTLPLLALTMFVLRYAGFLVLVPIGAALVGKELGVAVCEGSGRTIQRRVAMKRRLLDAFAVLAVLLGVVVAIPVMALGVVLLRPVLLGAVPVGVVGIGLARSVSARRVGEGLTKLMVTVSVLIGLLVAIPLMAFLGFTLRYALALAIPAGVIGAALALALDPSFRALILEKTADQRLRQIMGFMLSDNCLYSPSHTWTRVGIGRKEAEIGLDDFAQKLLGKAGAIELSVTPGTLVKQGETIGMLRHDGRSIPIKSPLEGVVSSLNRGVLSDPGRINHDPYGRGWILKLEPQSFAYDRVLLKAGEAAREWLQNELERFRVIVQGSPALAPVLQDGGVFVENLAEHLDDATWARLKESFFK